MRRLLLLFAAVFLVLTGCTGSSGTPQAQVPEARFDFGNVPVTSDMKNVRTKQFLIENTGTADLRLGEVQVKTLEGC